MPRAAKPRGSPPALRCSGEFSVVQRHENQAFLHQFYRTVKLRCRAPPHTIIRMQPDLLLKITIAPAGAWKRVLVLGGQVVGIADKLITQEQAGYIGQLGSVYEMDVGKKLQILLKPEKGIFGQQTIEPIKGLVKSAESQCGHWIRGLVVGGVPDGQSGGQIGRFASFGDVIVPVRFHELLLFPLLRQGSERPVSEQIQHLSEDGGISLAP